MQNLDTLDSLCSLTAVSDPEGVQGSNPLSVPRF